MAKDAKTFVCLPGLTLFCNRWPPHLALLEAYPMMTMELTKNKSCLNVRHATKLQLQSCLQRLVGLRGNHLSHLCDHWCPDIVLLLKEGGEGAMFFTYLYFLTFRLTSWVIYIQGVHVMSPLMIVCCPSFWLLLDRQIWETVKGLGGDGLCVNNVCNIYGHNQYRLFQM